VSVDFGSNQEATGAW